MAFVVYIGFFANNATTVSNNDTKKTEDIKKDDTSKVKAEEKKNIQNPMVKVSEGKRAISLKTVLEAGVSRIYCSEFKGGRHCL